MRISDWSSDVCSSDLPPPTSQASNRRRFARSISLRPADSIPAVARPGGQGPRHKAGRWFELAGSSTEGRTQMRLLTAAAMALAAFDGRAQAQDFPTRPEEHTSEIQSLVRNSYAVVCLNNKNKIHT